MQRDFKRRVEQSKPDPQPRLQRRVDKPDLSTQKTARADQNAARRANFETFVQRFATTPEAKLATEILTTRAPTEQQQTEHQSNARALPAAQRVRLQRLLQSQHVTGSLSLGREALNPVRRASDQTVTDLTGLPRSAATIPAQSLEARVQRRRDAKTSAPTATLEQAEPQSQTLERDRSNLEVGGAGDGQNQLSHTSPTLRQNVQRSPDHSDAVSEHIGIVQTARVQRQRVVGARAGELQSQMLTARVQRLRAPDAPTLEPSGKAYTLTGQADRINTELPIMRAKHNHDPAYLNGDTKPVTDFARHVGLSLGRQYHVQRAKAGARPSDLSAAISRVHDGHDRANLLSGALMTFSPNDREATSVQRLVAERETELSLQRQALETDLETVAQRMAEREAEHPENLAAMIAKAGGGEGLPERVKRQLQPQFNFSLDIVRIHRDGYADQLAKTVNAVAFTTGTGIFFRSGRFDPSSSSGRGLLVHELTHVGQQLEGRVAKGIDENQENSPNETAAAMAGAIEEGKGALPEADARDAVGSQSLGSVKKLQQTMNKTPASQQKPDNSEVQQSTPGVPTPLIDRISQQTENSLALSLLRGNSIQRRKSGDETISKQLNLGGRIPGNLFGKLIEFDYKIVGKQKGINGLGGSGIGSTELGIKIDLSKAKEKVTTELKTALLKMSTNVGAAFGEKKIVFHLTIGEATVSLDKLDTNKLLESVKSAALKVALIQIKASFDDTTFIEGLSLNIDISAKIPLEALLELDKPLKLAKEWAEFLGSKNEKLFAKQIDLLDEAEQIAKKMSDIQKQVKDIEKPSKTIKVVSRATKAMKRNATRLLNESSKKIVGLLEKNDFLAKELEIIGKKFLENQARLYSLSIEMRTLIEAEKPFLRKFLVIAIESKFGQIVARFAPRALLTLGKVLSVVGWVLLIIDLIQAANGLLLLLSGHRKFKFLGGDDSVGYFDIFTETDKDKFQEGDSDKPSSSGSERKPNETKADNANNGGNVDSNNISGSNQVSSSKEKEQSEVTPKLQGSNQIRLLSFMTSNLGIEKFTKDQYAQLISIIGSYNLDEKAYTDTIQQLTSGSLGKPDEVIRSLQQILAKTEVSKTTIGNGNPSSSETNKKRRGKRKTLTGQGMGGAPTKQQIPGDVSSRLVPYIGEIPREQTVKIFTTLNSFSKNKRGEMTVGKCTIILTVAGEKTSILRNAIITKVQPDYIIIETGITKPMAWRKGTRIITILEPEVYATNKLKRQ